MKLGLLLYLVIAVMFGFLQRRLIYYPSRAESIRSEQAQLQTGLVHDVTAETDDDLQLRGWHFLANGRGCETREQCDRELAAGRLLVLFFHGNAGDRRNRVSICQILTDLKADVFLFDYRGYGDNPGSPTEEGLAVDARAVWKYATEQRKVPPERIVLYGASLGGGVAIRLASELCEAGTPPAGLMLRSTFTSLTDVAGFHFPWLPVRLLLVERYPSTERIPIVTCPILHIHGARDKIIPIQYGQRLFNTAPEKSKSGIEKRFVEISEAGHNDIFYVARSEYHTSVETFFEAIRASRR